jgi:hypothetical protein
MLIHEPKVPPAEVLVEAGLITTPEKNLRSKLDSILRSIENLTQKRLRIEFEIKKQKASLLKKRQELRRSTKSRSAKMKIALESSDPTQMTEIEEAIKELQRLDSIALQKSDQVLNQD